MTFGVKTPVILIEKIKKAHVNRLFSLGKHIMEKDLEDLFVEGQFRFMDEDFDAAIKIFSGILEKDQKLDKVYQARAVSYLRLNKIDEALQDMDLAISCSPENPRLIYRKSAIFFQKGDMEKALEFVNQSIEMDPGFPAAYVLRSKIFEKIGDEEQASADIYRASVLKKKSSSNVVDW